MRWSDEICRQLRGRSGRGSQRHVVKDRGGQTRSTWEEKLRGRMKREDRQRCCGSLEDSLANQENAHQGLNLKVEFRSNRPLKLREARQSRAG